MGKHPKEDRRISPKEGIELDSAKELPAWTMLKVLDPIVGWRAFSAHEICVLAEMFGLWQGEEFLNVGRALGLILDESDEDE